MRKHLRPTDFTLFKAVVLISLIAIGQLAVSLRDTDVQGDETFEAASLNTGGPVAHL